MAPRELQQHLPEIPGEPAVPSVLLEAHTPTTEARAAMTVVATLHERGVPIRDIVVVAPEIASYESQLRQAAIRHGIPATMWTQLTLTETEPYRLCAAVCAVLEAADDRPVPIETVCAPLQHGWLPPTPAVDESETWPIETATLQHICETAPAIERSCTVWIDWLRDADPVPSQLTSYAAWLRAQPTSPTPTAVMDVLGGVIDRYDARRLPQLWEQDDPALTDTERAVRAVARLNELIERVAGKFGEWITADRATASWATVAQLLESLATQRPGRREHGNARALDVIEAADAWGRSDPYVIAIGLTEGHWPPRTEPPLPHAVQHAVIDGGDGLEGLAPQMQWRGYRAADRLAETVQAATSGLILTRHTQTRAGVPAAPSPFLDDLTLETVEPATVQALLSTERSIPPALDTVLPDRAD